MEPTLCFRLCETPMIYLQKTLCRCAGSGLMDYNRQRDSSCSIPCKAVVGGQGKPSMCGGKEAYAVYAEEQFYTRHAHLLNYQIKFASCQFWNTSDYYDTVQVQIDESSTNSSLNKLERCAAACLDRNATTKSVGFNGDSNQCLCILSPKSNTESDRALSLTILPNNKCDRHCDNILGDSNVEHNFQCGSLSNQRIWAIYDLNYPCLIGSVYIEELQKCVSVEKSTLTFCSSPSIKYMYDGNITWNAFLKVIEKLNLTKSMVSINFDNNATIDSSWKCSNTTHFDGSTRSSSFYDNPKTIYILSSGCLIVTPYFYSSYRPFDTLCVEDPLNKDSLPYNSMLYESVLSDMDFMKFYCPTDWFDLNRNCYRMSTESKSIQKARTSCINKRKADLSENDEDIVLNDDDGAIRNETNDEHKKSMENIENGEIVQYTSGWQARLGYYLLDTRIVLPTATPGAFQSFNQYPSVPVTTIDMNRLSVNEFQMDNPRENNNSIVKDDSCIILTRSAIDEKESSVVRSIEANNCSKPRRVLCKTKSPFIQSHELCLSNPLTLGLPTIISNYLSHESCVTICQALKTNFAAMSVNKCYCINSNFPYSRSKNLTYEKYRTKDCGKLCPGNQHQHCGNEKTIVALYIPFSILWLEDRDQNKMIRPNPDFVYESCIHLNSVNQSTMYEFNLTRAIDVHPRHCLELCVKYQQKYALMNSNKCLCTNIRLKNKNDNPTAFIKYSCTQECHGNYFYSCGNSSNSTIYSMYAMQTTCPRGFQVIEEQKRCVHANISAITSSYSNAQAYCKSVGGMLARINGVLEIQDILPKSFVSQRIYSIFSVNSARRAANESKYFWIDRKSDGSQMNTTSDHSIVRCSLTPRTVDGNCIVLRYEKTRIDQSVTYQRCFAESDQCSSMSALPVCVDQNLELNSIVNHPAKGNEFLESVNTTVNYSCGNETDYHLINGLCYKVNIHEMTWQESKSKCERENATLFIPEDDLTVMSIRSLFLHQRSYSSSSVLHVDVFGDKKNRSGMNYRIMDESSLSNMLDADYIPPSCGKIFLGRSFFSVTFSSVSMIRRYRFQDPQSGCGYVDIRSVRDLSISCDERSCDQLATAVCQKAPIQTSHAVVAERVYGRSNSAGRHLASIFWMFSLVFILLIIGLTYVLYNRYLMRKNHSFIGTTRRNNDSAYSQLSTRNEFDLN
ncbi:unnamed protein product [Rotaria magnacalcarata]